MDLPPRSRSTICATPCRPRHGRHGPPRADRHAGPPAGKAADRAATSWTCRSQHGREACNYLLAVDVEMNTVDGYAMSSWERGYGDFELKPDFGTLRLDALDTRARRCASADLRVGRRLAGRGLAAPDPARAARPPARARTGGVRRHRARVHRLPRHLRGGVREGLSRPQAGQPVQQRLLDPRRHAGRAAVAPDPQPDGRRGHGGRELQGRVQRRPARDQLPLRAGAADRRRALDLQDRRQGDRRGRGASRSRSWPSTTSARGRRVTSTSRSARRRTRVRPRRGALRALRRRSARLPARAEPVLRAQRQLLQALREGLLRAHRGRLGP